MAQQTYQVVVKVGRPKPVKHNVVCVRKPEEHGDEICEAIAPEYRIAPDQVEILSSDPPVPPKPKKSKAAETSAGTDGEQKAA